MLRTLSHTRVSVSNEQLMATFDLENGATNMVDFEDLLE